MHDFFVGLVLGLYFTDDEPERAAELWDTRAALAEQKPVAQAVGVNVTHVLFPPNAEGDKKLRELFGGPQSPGVQPAAYLVERSDGSGIGDFYRLKPALPADAKVTPLYAAPLPAWVPCSERLPEEDALVIVEGGVAYYRGGWWYTVTGVDWPGRLISWTVHQWQPLPSPPSEGK